MVQIYIYIYIGIKKDMDLIVHCQAGIGATVLYNILDSMGYKIRLYDGSWSEYVIYIYIMYREMMKVQ